MQEQPYRKAKNFPCSPEDAGAEKNNFRSFSIGEIGLLPISTVRFLPLSQELVRKKSFKNRLFSSRILFYFQFDIKQAALGRRQINKVTEQNGQVKLLAAFDKEYGTK